MKFIEVKIDRGQRLLLNINHIEDIYERRNGLVIITMNRDDEEGKAVVHRLDENYNYDDIIRQLNSIGVNISKGDLS